MSGLVSFALGLFAWTFVEYVIHGWLSHTFKTFATPLHMSHHRDPSAVFTLGAWPFAAVILLVGWAFSGWSAPMVFYSGLLSGFIVYEVVHYRLHYCVPATNLEAWLRSHHLVHHMRTPRACYGVSTALWDRLFGTEPSESEMAELARSVEHIRPLTVPSNLGRVASYISQRI